MVGILACFCTKAPKLATTGCSYGLLGVFTFLAGFKIPRLGFGESGAYRFERHVWLPEFGWGEVKEACF
jgi:hypothetical protein